MVVTDIPSPMKNITFLALLVLSDRLSFLFTSLSASSNQFWMLELDDSSSRCEVALMNLALV